MWFILILQQLVYLASYRHKDVGRWAEETPEPDPRKARRYALAREESQEAQLPALPPPLLPTNS